jgi:hypothetical protein
MNFDEAMGIIVPAALVFVIVGWICWKFQDPIKFMLSWIKDTFMSGVDKVQGVSVVGTELTYKA